MQSPFVSAPYIRYGGNFVPRPPYDIRNITGYGFAANGDITKIQALVDKTLNFHGEEPYYKAISSTVLFTFMNMGALLSANPKDAGKGAYRETELNLTVLLAAGKHLGGVFVPERLVWHMPYLWLNAGTPLIAGREFFGYPKQLGTIAMPRSLSEGETAEFSCIAEVISRFAPDAHSSMQPIVKVQRTDGNSVQFARGFQAIEEAAAGFIKEVMQTDLLDLVAGSIAEALTLKHLLLLVFLRQLPSISDGSRACYQSIAETSFDVTRFGSAGFLQGKFAIDIIKQDTAPIASDLGFAATNADGDARVVPEFGYYLDFDFQLNSGQEIWVAR